MTAGLLPDAAVNPEIATADDAAFLARLRPKLENAEKERLQRYDQYINRRKWAIGLFAVLAPFTGWVDYMLLLVWSSRDHHGAGLTVLLAGGLYTWVTAPKRVYARAYKNRILPDIAALFGLSYDLGGGLPLGGLKATGILPSYDRMRSEDRFAGIYRGAKIAFAEIELSQRRNNGKRTHYVTVFKGLGVLIDMPQRKFYGHTILVQDGTGIGEWLREKTSGLARADLVDPVFERKYSVFTDDQTEARYLLDPAMIERINAVGEVHVAEKISVSYYKDQVFMLLSCDRNLFEPPDIYIPATDPDGMRHMRDEVASLLQLIDHLAVYKPAA